MNGKQEQTKPAAKGGKGAAWATGAGLVLGSALAAVLLSVLAFFEGLEYRLYDLRFKRRGPVPVDSAVAVIVAIDQATLEALSFPMDRAHYAALIRMLNRLGARQIVFDIDFSSVGAFPRSDSLFKAAIAEAGNVILDGGISRQYVSGLRKPLTRIKVPSEAVAPPGTPWGLINDLVDADGVTRRYPLFLVQDSVAYLSLGLKTYQVVHGLPAAAMDFSLAGDFQFGDLRIPRALDPSSTMLNYYGPAAHFPTYSFLSVLNGEYDFDRILADLSPDELEVLKASGMADVFSSSPFQGKIVLIGASADDLQDNKFTPFYSSEKPFLTPGVEVHANALQALHDRNFLRFIDYTWILVAVVTLTGAVYALGRLLPQGVAALGAAVIIATINFGGQWLFTHHNLILREIPLLLAVVLAYPANLVYHIIQTQKEKALIRGMFAQYVSREVTEALIANPELVKLGGEKRRMTVLFTDVAGFTTISERLTPEELVHLLNEYLTALTQVILDHRGIIDKYEGDLIMAEFGAPVWYPEHAEQACRAALQMQKTLAKMREKWRAEGRDELHNRIGINTGEMLVGNMGSAQVFDYTVMGDSVNLASRLEGANKNYRTTIMIGKETWDDVHNKFVTRPLDLLRVKGKKRPVEVFELIAEHPEELSAGKAAALEHYMDGMIAYRQRHFREACEEFEAALKVCPDDGPSQVYYERAKAYFENPPPDDWDGVWELHEK